MTEKLSRERETTNKYAFEVHLKANKIDIARAIETIYGVKVLSVNVMPKKGKNRRLGWKIGRTSNWKRAVVTLAEGDTIDIYEGVSG